MLRPEYLRQDDEQTELLYSQAACIRDVSEKDPDRGVDLVLSVQVIKLSSLPSDISVLASNPAANCFARFKRSYLQTLRDLGERKFLVHVYSSTKWSQHWKLRSRSAFSLRMQ